MIRWEVTPDLDIWQASPVEAAELDLEGVALVRRRAARGVEAVSQPICAADPGQLAKFDRRFAHLAS